MRTRQEKSRPILLELKKLLDAEADRYLAKNGMADAVGYLRHGQARINNNLTEQAIRPFKLGANYA